MASVTAAPTSPVRAVSLVGTAHFMSHLYYQALPPLYVLMVVDLGVGYTALGLIMTVYHIATASVATPVGFLVDRIGARRMLVGGLVIQAAAMIAAGFFNSYWALMGLFAVSGLAFAVYHPADYAIISGSVRESWLGRAFSVHSFSGNLGNALTPILVLAIATLWSWQIAFFIIGGVGVVIALLIIQQAPYLRDENDEKRSARKAAKAKGETIEGDAGSLRRDIALLLSGPVMFTFFYYVISNVGIGGLRTYGVAGLVELHGTPLTLAGSALTGYMIGASGGLLVGGFIADRYGAKIFIAALGLTASGILVGLVGSLSMPVTLMIAVLAFGGFMRGMVQSTRDILVLSITPKGATGKVFAFVYNGSMIGGALIPFIYGWFMDNGHPGAVFWIAGGSMIASLVTFVGLKGAADRKKAAEAA
jgi:FSR family fosmidomycin resistance protein-like MFS transporter